MTESAEEVFRVWHCDPRHRQTRNTVAGQPDQGEVGKSKILDDGRLLPMDLKVGVRQQAMLEDMAILSGSTVISGELGIKLD